MPSFVDLINYVNEHEREIGSVSLSLPNGEVNTYASVAEFNAAKGLIRLSLELWDQASDPMAGGGGLTVGKKRKSPMSPVLPLFGGFSVSSGGRLSVPSAVAESGGGGLVSSLDVQNVFASIADNISITSGRPVSPVLLEREIVRLVPKVEKFDKLVRPVPVKLDRPLPVVVKAHVRNGVKIARSVRGGIWIKGYRRTDGTRVHGYARRRPQ